MPSWCPPMTVAASTPTLLSAAFFVAFSAVAAFDATYFHFMRFRLWAHPETRKEHAFHAMRAVLMAPMLVFLFTPGRAALLAAALLVALDFAASGLDVAAERRSRARFGGLPHGEYVVHLLATTLHVAALVLAFVGRLAPDPLAAPCPWMTAVVGVLVVGSLLSAAHHVALLCCGSVGLVAARSVV